MLLVVERWKIVAVDEVRPHRAPFGSPASSLGNVDLLRSSRTT